MTKIVSFSERDLRAAMSKLQYGLTPDQNTRVVDHLMTTESTRTPRQIEEVKALRGELERVRRSVKQAINMTDELCSMLDGILSIQTSKLKDEDES